MFSGLFFDKIAVTVHAIFFCRHKSNDIALIKLSKPVDLTVYVHLACLPRAVTQVTKKRCYLAGWGRVSGMCTHNTTDKLRFFYLVIEPATFSPRLLFQDVGCKISAIPVLTIHVNSFGM